MKNIEIEPLSHSHHALQIQYTKGQKSVTICKDHKHIGYINIIDSDKEHTAIQNKDTITILISPETLEGRSIRKFINYSSCFTIDNVKPCVFDVYEKLYLGNFNEVDIVQIINELVFHLVGGDIKELQELDTRILQILESMSNKEMEELTLKKLSSETYLSESRFQHLFKENTGLSLSKYLLWVKTISAIKRVFSGESLTDAALNSGFSDSPHFTRTFKKIVGLTPKVLNKFISSLK